MHERFQKRGTQRAHVAFPPRLGAVPRGATRLAM